MDLETARDNHNGIRDLKRHRLLDLDVYGEVVSEPETT
jgi:hypothetical protein